MKMLKIGTLLPLGLALAISVILIGFYVQDDDEISDDLYPDAGEIWEHYPNGGNPFEVVKVRYILDVKEGYVKYIEDNDTIVMVHHNFALWSKRVK